MTRLNEKVAIVSGAGSGIGRASAVRLAENGARLAITDLDADELAATAAAVEAAGAPVVQVAGDIVDPATIDQVATAAIDAFGQIDVLDNNVGILVVKPIAEHTIEDFDRLMHINCWSYLQTTQRVAPEMRKTGGGSIINISSIGGLVALPMVAAYCASKAAVIGLTRSIAYELAPDIRCNVICPGGVETPMSAGHIAGMGDRDEAIRLTTGRQLQKRFAKPEEIASAVVFLASDEASFMTAAGVLPQDLAAALGSASCRDDLERTLSADPPDDAVLDLAQLTWLAPIAPPRFRDFMSFEQHHLSARHVLGRPVPDVTYALPTYYKAGHLALLGHEEAVPWPGYCEWMDFELELGFVVGRGGTDLTPDEAEECLFGVTLLNDFSARDP